MNDDGEDSLAKDTVYRKRDSYEDDADQDDDSYEPEERSSYGNSYYSEEDSYAEEDLYGEFYNNNKTYYTIYIGGNLFNKIFVDVLTLEGPAMSFRHNHV